MSEISLTYRLARADDDRRLFEWRNSPDVYRYFQSPEPVSWEDHQQWFSASLKNEQRLILIGDLGSKSVGMLRTDFQSDTTALISIHMDPTQFGKGLGSRLLSDGSREVKRLRPQLKKLIAEVHRANAPSLRLFEKCGFTLEDNSGEFWRYELEIA